MNSESYSLVSLYRAQNTAPLQTTPEHTGDVRGGVALLRSCLKRPDGSGVSEERRLSFAGSSGQYAAQQPATPPALYTAHPMGRSALVMPSRVSRIAPATCLSA